MSEPIKGTPSTVLQKLKQRLSRRMKNRKKQVTANQWRLGFDQEEESSRPFWQSAILRLQCL
jgi:hypothetical protein